MSIPYQSTTSNDSCDRLNLNQPSQLFAMGADVVNVVSDADGMKVGKRVSWGLCTKGNVIHLCAVHTELLGYWSRR